MSDKEQELLDHLMDRVLNEVVADLKQSISSAVEQELTKTLSRSLLESEFHRRLNEEMREGLQHIYKEINAAAKGNGDALPDKMPADKKTADQLFHEAAGQLDMILQTTEEAAEQIMDIVEKHLSTQADSNKILHSLKSGGVTKAQLHTLRDMSDELNADLMNIMTVLSFQDLTGQRIKKIIEAIKKVEGIVFDLYMTTGIKLKRREEAPEKDIEELETEAREKVSELKGPQSDVNQSEVDDLLAQLGLE